MTCYLPSSSHRIILLFIIIYYIRYIYIGEEGCLHADLHPANALSRSIWEIFFFIACSIFGLKSSYVSNGFCQRVDQYGLTYFFVYLNIYFLLLTPVNCNGFTEMKIDLKAYYNLCTIVFKLKINLDISISQCLKKFKFSYFFIVDIKKNITHNRPTWCLLSQCIQSKFQSFLSNLNVTIF